MSAADEVVAVFFVADLMTAEVAFFDVFFCVFAVLRKFFVFVFLGLRRKYINCVFGTWNADFFEYSSSDLCAAGVNVGISAGDSCQFVDTEFSKPSLMEPASALVGRDDQTYWRATGIAPDQILNFADLSVADDPP